MPNFIPITLTSHQMDIAHDEAMARYRAARARQATAHNQYASPIESELRGIMGELAFAQWSGLPWSASKGSDYRPGEPDVGNCEVKTRKPGYDLFARLKEFTYYKPNRFYVLAWATVGDPVVELVGYSTLGFIHDYGQWRDDMKSFLLPWQLTIDVEELYARER
jgi:hypothetical protein